MADNRNNVTIENARLIFLNFAGKEDKYNREGDRNFGVILPPDVAEAMLRDGWNVKVLQAREEGDEDTAYIQVAVSFKNRPPKIVMLTSTTRTHLNEDTVEALDYAEIETVDLILTPYVWEVNDKSGIKAYLKSMYVTIQEDELDRKYAQKDANAHDDSYSE